MTSNKSSRLVLGVAVLFQAATAVHVYAAQLADQADSAFAVVRQSGATGNINKPLITIKGLCNHATAAAKVDCKTVITRGQFESLVNVIDPGMPRHARMEFAEQYADGLVMAAKAEQMGLDKDTNFEERMKFARVEVLSQILKKRIVEEASSISDKDIEDFYQKNITRFERAELDRIYLPREPKSASAISDPTPASDQEHWQESDQKRRKEAEDLYARALKGEAFAVLQADAYAAAGIKSSPPGAALSVRRIALPPDQASVMDLKPGEVSSVLVNSNGYFIYKMKTKDILPLDQVRSEVKEALRTQRLQDAMDEVLDSASTSIDDSYFAQ
ncbi:MAG TPA: peptidylprolyl isomerase [Terracidiphilus sp.]|nr:peptidylprolyl isomerase [Terracidiphilus sp.]